MLTFILNNELIKTHAPSGMALLDFIRKEHQLKGAKLVCKEGECGACTVLVGSKKGKQMEYLSMTSCIMPLINAQGKHIVTIEGLNMEGLSPVQQAMVDAYGSQCGFCTPGFVVSLSGYLLSNDRFSREGIIESIDGNICRCTGYKSIERAAEAIVGKVENDVAKPSIKTLVKAGYFPAYFEDIPKRLQKLEIPKSTKVKKGVKLGGGTDLYVQKPYQMYETEAVSVFDQPKLNYIKIKDGICRFGASMTMGDLYRSETFREAVPVDDLFFKLLSSTQIRNMSTIGGNLVNASPIGDFTVFLLGLNSDIILNRKGKRRKIPLRSFYKDYKKMDLKKGEYLEEIQFKIPDVKTYVHFEKVSQRRFLDIASVNFASRIRLDKQNHIKSIHLAVGGVGPIPMYLKETVKQLKGKQICKETVELALACLEGEISPISDARGSAAYKRLLARQLCIAQFLQIDPELLDVQSLIGA